MTRLSSSSAGICCSALPEHDPRRRAIGAHDPQRQAEHLVHARIHVAQVQALDDDRAAAEQHMVRRGARTS